MNGEAPTQEQKEQRALEAIIACCLRDDLPPDFWEKVFAKMDAMQAQETGTVAAPSGNEAGAASTGSVKALHREIMLRCPTCKRTMMVDRGEFDPPTALVLESECERCEPDTGKFEESHYFDADGREVFE